MVSLIPGPVSCFVSRNSLTDSDTFLSLRCFCAFNPKNSAKAFVNLSSRRGLVAARRSGGSGLGFLEGKEKKKGYCSRCGGFLRMCKKDDMGWDSEGTKNLEAEILEFMKNSDKPGMFPTKKDLIRAGRFDLVEGVLNQGGWLAMGWDSDEKEEGGGNGGNIRLQENGYVRYEGLVIEKKLQNDGSQERNGAWSSGNPNVGLNFSASSLPSASGTSLEENAECESGIEGILIRLEKERNLSLGISLREKGKSNGSMNDNCQNGPVPESCVHLVSEFRAITEPDSNSSRSVGEDEENKFLEGKSLSGMHGLSSSTKPETWRTWSLRRAGVLDADFEAAENSPGSFGGENDDGIQDSGDSMNEKERDNSFPEERNKTSHINSRLQHLQAELSSVLHSLRSHTDEVVTKMGSEIHSGNLENLIDAWEFQENDIMIAQDKLRSTRAKLAVLEGKMAMAITDAQRIIREKQKRIDHAHRALRLLRNACIVWPNAASEVLLSGSFDGWSTQRKMEKSKNGVFSLTLKLYPGRYEIKFIVDGQWKVDPLRPIVDSDGHENNLLMIS